MPLPCRMSTWRTAVTLNNSSTVLMERGYPREARDLLRGAIHLMQTLLSDSPAIEGLAEGLLQRQATYLRQSTPHASEAEGSRSDEDSEMPSSLVYTSNVLLSVDTNLPVTADILFTGMRPIYIRPVHSGMEPSPRELEIQASVLMLNMAVALQDEASELQDVTKLQKMFRNASKLLQLSLQALCKQDFDSGHLVLEYIPETRDEFLEALRVCPLCLMALRALMEFSSDVLFDKASAQHYYEAHQVMSELFCNLTTEWALHTSPDAACA